MPLTQIPKTEWTTCINGTKIGRNKIEKLQKEASKHKFKPDINPVSKLITEKDKKELSLRQSVTSDSSSTQKPIVPSVHEKLYMSRNSSHKLLPANSKSCLKQQQESMDCRSNSVADLKIYNSPMPRIKEERLRRLPPSGPKGKKKKQTDQSPAKTPKVNGSFKLNFRSTTDAMNNFIPSEIGNHNIMNF